MINVMDVPLTFRDKSISQWGKMSSDSEIDEFYDAEESTPVA